MQRITNRVIRKLEGNQKAIGRLMVLFNKSSKTIERWIDDRDVRLTTPQAIVIIREETGLAEDQILEVGAEAKGAA